ncbi:hypothetical protein A8924_7364 [Saccharopolyspora erythraea NRRL 2338]|uniref:Uncharacterized protein n=2 Tax=Saccharopolyspora erythraea TaxID=1836 RepID=A4FQ40_SACEN|nr:YciI family protein [Saccharopolyspora erythraea]EQD84401.1 hypothetical protein N599_20355 [Saccharopolyspora erythraea D]PFG99810.1 hypothetical protein A8924_7364 [Saccharopolyspora erythraea NRRL 2338]QRK89680.1 hypothetical protein JQX30_35055 [Saccharopolyspora erythraea]CAM06165.1 hypothetical protein SACE_7003 [Saccharopolyspora erythraea NRRL 2338]
MKFALVIVETEASRQRIRQDRAAHRAAYEQWIGAVAGAGKLVGGEAFETEHSSPVTVRRDADGSHVVTETPFAGESETLGGWFVVDVEDRAEAVELAKALETPETVEVRPLQESA